MPHPAPRTIFCVRHEPFPAVGGAALRNWQNILACARLGPVQVLCTGSKRDGAVLVGDNITMRHYGGDEAQMLPEAVASRLRGLPRRAYDRVSKVVGGRRVYHAVERDIRSFAPTVAVFEEYKCAALIPALRAMPVSIIYDAHNVEARLQQSLLAGRALGAGEKRYILGIMKRERALAAIADQAWVCSEIERNNIREAFHRLEDVRVIPNAIDPLKYAAAFDQRFGPARGEPLHVIFSGSYEYYPNQQAAQFLIGQIFPRIVATVPDAQLVLAGRAPTGEMEEAARKDARILVTGAVPDIAPYLERSQISLVPLCHGGGTRFKILEAFASGSAVISTRKGAEGLSVVDGRHLLFAESADEFAIAAGRLWDNTRLRQSIIREAHRHVVAHYATEVVQHLVANAVEDAGRAALSCREQSNRWQTQPGLPTGSDRRVCR